MLYHIRACILDILQDFHPRNIGVLLCYVGLPSRLGHFFILIGGRLGVLAVSEFFTELVLCYGAEAARLGIDSGNEFGEILGLLVGDGERP